MQDELFQQADNIRNELIERTKLRYTGDCKCGKCHLVDLGSLYDAIALLQYFQLAIMLSTLGRK
jgi:hypothetical protein